MSTPDFNLLVTLDVLLAEGSVARAAERLRLSPSAMSRALARLRATTGDPLLVRAGRGLVPTPRAIELRERVTGLVQGIEEVLRPAEALDIARVERTLTMRTSDGFVETFGADLLARLTAEAPGIRLRIVAKARPDVGQLRDGLVDLETGVVDEASGPELRAQALFHDRFVGVVRSGHALSRGRVTPKRFAACRHVHVSRRGRDTGLVDEALGRLGLARDIACIVDGFAAGLALVRGTDLVAVVPEQHTRGLRTGLHTFRLPIALDGVAVSLLWHPRLDSDPVHRWLRELVRDVCTTTVRRKG